MANPTTNKKLSLRFDDLEEYVKERLDELEDAVSPLGQEVAAANLRLVGLQKGMQYIWDEVLTDTQRKAILDRAEVEGDVVREEIPRIIIPSMVN